MADEILGQLDTSGLAKEFNDFLASQGLGEMNPSTAARYRDGVEVSPMDNILLANGFDIDSVFAKRLPEPPPLASLGNDDGQTASSTRSDESIQNAKAAVKSLGLSSDELATLGNLLSQGGGLGVGTLPAPMLKLLYNNPGVNNAEDLLLQLGELYGFLNGLQPPDGRDLTEVMLFMMAELQTDDSSFLLRYLRQNPHLAKDALRDPLTGITGPLGWSTSLLKPKTVFDIDPIIGSMSNETLLANRAGGSRLTGGGGSDLYVIALRSNPFASATALTDFSQNSGSKLVLDTTDYEWGLNKTYKVASTKNRLAKLLRSDTALILNRKTDDLLLNANRTRRGLGLNGGIVASLENGATLDAADILLFDGNSLFGLDGSTYNV
jgi:hypothetical protein